MKNSNQKGILKTEPKKTIKEPQKTSLPDKKDDKRPIIKTEPSKKPTLKS